MLRSFLALSMLCAPLCLGGCAVATDDSPEAVGEAPQAAHRHASYGGKCGGFTANPIQCATGLTCSHTDEHGHLIHPDLPGVCLQAKGKSCGGFTTHAKVCTEGLSCHLALAHPDSAGTCE